jgi:hypothetical protein
MSQYGRKVDRAPTEAIQGTVLPDRRGGPGGAPASGARPVNENNEIVA